MDKIIVGLKRVIDYNVRVQVKSDGTGVETDGVKMSINPFDEIALEEALRIKESGQASEVIVVSIGATEAQQQLRTGLAMGADRAILVKVDGAIDPLSIARTFKHLAVKENAAYNILVKHALQLYKATNGKVPQSHDEFMREIIEKQQIELPELPAGHRYVFDPEQEQLMVERPKQ